MNENNNIINDTTGEITKTKSQKNIVLIIVVILIIGLFAVGGWYLLGNKKNGTVSTNDFERHGKEVSIYYVKDNSEDNQYDLNYISDISDDYQEISQNKDIELTKKGKITCKGNDCKITEADIIDQYVAVYEENEMYLYDYNNDKVVFGPVSVRNVNDDYSSFEGFICDRNVDGPDTGDCSGFYASADSRTNVYTFDKKAYNDLEGYFIDDFGIYFKYGYLPVTNYNGEKEQYTVNFYNVKTGKLDYTYDQVEDLNAVEINNNIYTITSMTKSNSDDLDSYKFKVYDINNHKLFDDVDDVYIEKNLFIIWNDSKLSVYNTDGKKMNESSKYDELLYVDQEYAVVKNGNQIQLIDVYGKYIATLVTSNDSKLDINNSRCSEITNHVSDTSHNLHGLYEDNTGNKFFMISVDDSTVQSKNVQSKYLPTEDEVTQTSYGYVYYYDFKNQKVNREAMAFINYGCDEIGNNYCAAKVKESSTCGDVSGKYGNVIGVSQLMLSLSE